MNLHIFQAFFLKKLPRALRAQKTPFSLGKLIKINLNKLIKLHFDKCCKTIIQSDVIRRFYI